MESTQLYEVIHKTLGLAVEQTQVLRTLGAFLGFTGTQALVGLTAPAWLSNVNKEKWSETLVALAHHLVVCSACTYVIFNKEESEEINQDRLYGFSDKVNLIFSISTGYFMWDTYTIATRRFLKKDPQMLVHSIVCSFTYLFGQFPFLHYYGVRFLLFELSSIPLQLRQLLILLEYDKSNPVYQGVQKLFGLTFLFVRILYGLPLSMQFWKQCVGLLQGEHGRWPHSVGVVGYYFAANIILNVLNLFWFRFIYKKAFTK